MSSSHHPQTDGSSDVMNRMLENYIRFYFGLTKNIGIRFSMQRSLCKTKNYQSIRE